MNRREIIARAKKIVVKVGTHVIAGKNGDLDTARLGALARGIQARRRAGSEVVLVTSGAIGSGVGRLKLPARPEDLPTLQAAAAAGQTVLMNAYAEAFGALGAPVGQILLTHEDIRSRRRFLNARNTINRLLELGAVPIINENDTVAVEEVKFGDNDMLSALVTSLVGADLLVLLSTVDGFYEKFTAQGPVGRPLPVVARVTREMIEGSTVKTNPLSVGGMASKLRAVRLVLNAGEPVVIANGGKPEVLDRIFAGQDEGTLFLPRAQKLTTRKRWLAFFSKPAGQLTVDAGAENALRKKGSSLLPGGITQVRGAFKTGDTVSLCGPSGAEFARGISNYPADQVQLIRGRRTQEIVGLLGAKPFDEVVHRNNLVVFDE